MKIKEILKALNSVILKVNCDENMEFDYISSNSKDIKENTLFICRKGFNFDSHKIVDDVARNGAEIFIVEEEIEDYPYILVVDSRIAESIIADVFFQKPYEKLITFGVTGTNGKTTSVHLFHHIMHQFGIKGSISGTVLNDIMGDKFYHHNTTPSAIEITKNMFKTVIEDGKYYAMEVSSHALSQYRVESIRYDIVGITNITRDHLDFHQTFENYKRAKLHILNLLKPNGIAIVNHELIHDIPKKNIRVVTFGTDNNSDYVIHEIISNWSGIFFKLKTPFGEKKVVSQLLGDFNAFNVTLVIAALVEIGYDIDDVISAISTFRGVDGRLEIISEAKKLGIEIVIDFAHTPDALEKAILSIRKLTKGRIITVFGAGGQSDVGKRPMMGEIASKYSDICIITTDDPRGEDPVKIIKDIEEGVVSGSLSLSIIDRREAIDTAITLANRGDIILIAGRGHEPYQVFDENYKVPFKDRDVAIDIIYKKINKGEKTFK
ncbi:UDP-N-acetylmuramoyl-L-alanyl-D-glutamate--lysine ligase [Thermosipho melanesiensis]|uniref:UDP-N-acetylmuramyl-tripeptide synthetase n=2 Tax=Thermosipho melanesiensis TaxID=46541 RepID=A6LKS6_THEM4|nr:UDP-N-acetylmuramoyl-L-alanyl-D-glutamate--2,6-diaminopimelate ligase [Thermosipho melanesiensis]ABR30527.1 UDP-N-acetylmuramyl-tripeptide synthetase [Thermosipho melanesiensis BI429]APT73676.1 UDP-N-acetylmuramoyl-L-alanyl-D-glutamate--lysine ligase [Thermosipho melanesiensis]OOC35617.1 UDP-N-acetylmuramoyl-L-alanyl-D-glutamate--lysine ligase [Thermosipho melanesiensis]OOC39292.1 UDP-N-acetylmuramoyl-L-alanyl-D-glutamate--lysine ligase [Thermosipho melanesiensis]OOC39378.1 UDP-N-acetylmura